ncbi:hypothetical protein JXA85_02840 [Candidatus Woesearchaeota archaeon]|nr:hypothetical protein [Candidatus Woesearchaeota archaeon]
MADNKKEPEGETKKEKVKNWFVSNINNFARKVLLEKVVKNTVNKVVGQTVLRHYLPPHKTESIVFQMLEDKDVFKKHNIILGVLKAIEGSHEGKDNKNYYKVDEEMWAELLDYYTQIGPFREQKGGLQDWKSQISSGQKPGDNFVGWWCDVDFSEDSRRNKQKKTCRIGHLMPVPKVKTVMFEDSELLDAEYEFREGDQSTIASIQTDVNAANRKFDKLHIPKTEWLPNVLKPDAKSDAGKSLVYQQGDYNKVSKSKEEIEDAEKRLEIIQEQINKNQLDSDNAESKSVEENEDTSDPFKEKDKSLKEEQKKTREELGIMVVEKGDVKKDRIDMDAVRKLFNKIKGFETALTGKNQQAAWLTDPNMDGNYKHIFDELKEQLDAANLELTINPRLREARKQVIKTVFERIPVILKGLSKKIADYEKDDRIGNIIDGGKGTKFAITKEFEGKHFRSQIKKHSPENVPGVNIVHSHPYGAVRPILYGVKGTRKTVSLKDNEGKPIPIYWHKLSNGRPPGSNDKNKDYVWPDEAYLFGKGEKVVDVDEITELDRLDKHGFHPRSWELAPGIDENGYPLEVYSHEDGLKEGVVFLDEQFDKGNPTRRVPKSFIVPIDTIQHAAYVFNVWDEVRDTVRDARYHPKSLTIIDHIMAYSQVKGKEWELARFNSELPYDYGKYEMKLFHQGISQKEGTFKGGEHTVRTMEGRRSPTDLLPAFDLRALHKGGPLQYVGKQFYYDRCHEILKDESQQEVMTTRGLSMYIINAYMTMMKKFSEIDYEFHKHISKIKEFDYGPRVFGGEFPSWPYKVNFENIHEAHEKHQQKLHERSMLKKPEAASGK